MEREKEGHTRNRLVKQRDVMACKRYEECAPGKESYATKNFINLELSRGTRS